MFTTQLYSSTRIYARGTTVPSTRIQRNETTTKIMLKLQTAHEGCYR